MTYAETRVLQVVRLKGRPNVADLPGAAGLPEDESQQVLSSLLDAGCVEQKGERVKLTESGRERLKGFVGAERSDIDQNALSQSYQRFEPFNAEFKQVVTDWQLIDGEKPNDHSDPAYDKRVVQRLADLHERFLPLLRDMVDIAPRLGHYPDRFSKAIGQILDGDHSWLARPLADSYHTIWFELHEDLIELAGLSRAAEAAAGRAE